MQRPDKKPPVGPTSAPQTTPQRSAPASDPPPGVKKLKPVVKRASDDPLSPTASSAQKASPEPKKADRRESKAKASRGSRRRWPLVLLTLLTSATLFVVFLPQLVARTRLVQWAVDWAASDLAGRIRVGTAQLGFFQTLALSDVVVEDREGQAIAEIPAIRCDRTLWALLRQPDDLGQVDVEKPELRLVLRRDGSNIEDLLANYLRSDQPSRRRDLQLVLADATIKVSTPGQGPDWSITPMKATIRTERAAESPFQIELSGVATTGDGNGRFALNLALPSTGAGQAALTADTLPLAPLMPLARRIGVPAELSGRASGHVRTSWAAAGRATLETEIACEQFACTAPALQGDRLQSARLELATSFSLENGQITIERFTARGDMGSVRGRGVFPTQVLTPVALWSALQRESYEVETDLDLGCLARMLPTTLRVQKETRVVAGRVEGALRSRPENAAWEGRLELRDLKAVQAGRDYSLSEPVRLSFAVRRVGEGLEVDQLQCDSIFLKLQGRGTPQKFEAVASYDLGQLVLQAAQFFDLGGLRLAGQGTGRLAWKSDAAQAFQASLDLDAQQFQFETARGGSWSEPQLKTRLTVAGKRTPGGPIRLESGDLKIEAGSDQLQSQLREAIADLRQGPWPAGIELRGRLENWPGRLSRWINLAQWKPRGEFTLKAEGKLSASALQLDQGNFSVRNLALDAHGVPLEEPQADLAMAGRFDLTQRQVQFRSLALRTGTLTLGAEPLQVIAPPQGPLQAAGNVKYQGDLARVLALYQAVASPGTPSALRLAGDFLGEGKLEQSGGKLAATLDTTINGLTLARSDGTSFREPQIRFITRGQYDPTTALLRIEQFDLGSSSIAWRLTGEIDHRQRRGAGQGNVQYDVQRLCEFAQPYLGPGVSFAGRDEGPLSLRSAANWTGAEGTTILRWARGTAYGFDLGPAELKLKLAEGSLKADPVTCTASEGKLNFTPSLRLTPGAMELVVEPGEVAQRIRINPTVCQQALKFALPILADVAAAEGRFSVHLDACRIPLADPAKGQVAGRLVVHDVQVGPGPLVRELAVLVGGASNAQLTRESVIPFQMRAGRIYHDKMELAFPELTLQTSGSVGLDHTLDVKLQSNIPPRWFGELPVPAALRDQKVELGLAGTLERPTLDRRALDEASRRVLGNTARGLLQEQLPGALERLFGR